MKKSTMSVLVVVVMAVVVMFFLQKNNSLVSANDNRVFNGNSFLNENTINILPFIIWGGVREVPQPQPSVRKSRGGGQVFSLQPVACTVYEGENLEFQVVLYQEGHYDIRWQFQEQGDKVWINSSANGAHESRLVYIADSSYTGRKYRAVATNVVTGQETISDWAVLTVLPR